MQLSELFEVLSNGELSNLAIADEGSGTIIESAQPKIVGYANDGLLKLYSRFVLKEKELLLEQVPNVFSYKLLPQYAAQYVALQGTTAQPVKYIRDKVSDPFIGDIIKILAVFDSCERKVPLNDENHPMSVFTPQANLLQVPCVHPGRFLSLIYQARHKKLMNVWEEKVELPDVLYSALTAFIAYKVFSHMNTQDSTAKAQEHLGLYESICTEMVDKDLVNSSVSTTNLRFKQRGWV